MKHWPKLLLLLPADMALALAPLYALGYYACVRPQTVYTVQEHAPAKLHVVSYCWESTTLASFFSPANSCDRSLRPVFWRGEAVAPPPQLQAPLAALAALEPSSGEP